MANCIKPGDQVVITYYAVVQTVRRNCTPGEYPGGPAGHELLVCVLGTPSSVKLRVAAGENYEPGDKLRLELHRCE